MVGRERELEMLQRALDRVNTERTSHLFTLLGPAGVGKSRLVREFVSGRANSATVLRGRCLSYGEGITYFPLAEVVEEAAGVERTDDVATSLSKLSTLAEGVDDRDRIIALVAGLLSWAEPVTAEEAYWGVRKLFEHLASQGPLVVVFDDIHWAEPAFLDLIEYLSDWTRDAPLLLVCVARPELLELRTGWAGGKLNATTILLEPLPTDEVSRLVDNLLGRADIPSSARAQILDTADGNPLFVEEMLGMLIDDGLLQFDDGRWRAVENLANLTVPPTIQLLLAARLDRLDAEERAVIERGAVEGKVFHVGAVTTLAVAALRPQVRPRLLALARKELIRPGHAEFPGEDAFRFRHLLIRDAAYQAMPKEQRAELHQRFAAWLEHAAGERLAEYEEILAYHLEQAYRYRAELGPLDEATIELGRRAATRLIASADRARERGDLRGAQSLLIAATEVSDGSLRSRALFWLAYTFFGTNQFSESVEAARQATEAAEAAGELTIATRARLVLTEALGQIDPSHTFAQTEEEAAATLETLQRAGDDAGIVQATLTLATLLFYRGRCVESIEMTRSLLDRAPNLPSSDRHRIALILGTALYVGPYPADECLRAYATEFSFVKDSILSQAALDNLSGAALAMQGRADESRAQSQRAEQRVLDMGLPALSSGFYLGRGEAERTLGRSDLAAAYFRRSTETLDNLGETSFNSTATALLALVLCDLGRFDDAEPFVQRSRELSAEDDIASQAHMRMALARILSHRGNHVEALTTIAEAIAINESSDYLASIAESHETRAGVLLANGRVNEARAEFEQAAEMYERKGIVPWAGRVRRVLEGLRPQSP
ncbi:MAG TPA: AAA family ATPase [Propionibacteriaceae bacterium]|nr:AAA family ATPase [Propionibacteriaceae bacterium]